MCCKGVTTWVALIAHTCWSNTAAPAALLCLDQSVFCLYYFESLTCEKEREGLVVLCRSRQNMAKGWIRFLSSKYVLFFVLVSHYYSLRKHAKSPRWGWPWFLNFQTQRPVKFLSAPHSWISNCSSFRLCILRVKNICAFSIWICRASRSRPLSYFWVPFL